MQRRLPRAIAAAALLGGVAFIFIPPTSAISASAGDAWDLTTGTDVIAAMDAEVAMASSHSLLQQSVSHSALHPLKADAARGALGGSAFLADSLRQTLLHMSDSVLFLCYLGLFVLVLGGLAGLYCYMTSSDRQTRPSGLLTVHENLSSSLNTSGRAEHVVHAKAEPVGEDTYGLALTSLVRDVQKLYETDTSMSLRLMRLTAHASLHLCNIGIQVFLLSEIMRLCTSQAVHNIRETYDAYETHMYRNHTTVTADGHHVRGIPSFYSPELFDSFPRQKLVCAIPFSQPSFFMTIIFVWTLTCVGEIRKIALMFSSIVLDTPTTKSMEHCLEADDGTDDLKDDVSDTSSARMASGGSCVIVGLTTWMKAFLVLFVLAPWLVMTCTLLWLGCRWLAATNDFTEILLNAVALEFILLLKKLLYETLVPAWAKREVSNTSFKPPRRREGGSVVTFLAAFAWGLLAVVWVLYYTYHFQSVLPDYRWDVRGPCSSWIETAFAI